MQRVERKRIIRNLIIFTALVLALAGAGGIIDVRLPEESKGLGQLLWIAAPLLAMLLMRTVGGDGWSDLGLKPNFAGNGFWYLVSLVIFPLTLLLVLVAGQTAGMVYSDPRKLGIVAGTLGGALVFSAIKNIFEEFAWRGYLAPKMYRLDINTWTAHGLVGLIWGLWHLPFITQFWTYVTPEMTGRFIPFFLLGSISHSIVYGEIRLATNSVWPAWLMHTVGNTLGTALLSSGLWRMQAGMEFYFSPGAESLAATVVMTVTGIALHRRRLRTKTEGANL
jgi:membrane protease YdiL (CAAX protease family)